MDKASLIINIKKIVPILRYFYEITGVDFYQLVRACYVRAIRKWKHYEYAFEVT